MRVNIHGFTSQEANERLMRLLGKIDGEAARGRNGRDERDAAGEGLLDDLK